MTSINYIGMLIFSLPLVGLFIFIWKQVGIKNALIIFCFLFGIAFCAVVGPILINMH